MHRREFLSALLGTPTLLAVIAACGDDSKDAAGISYPSGANDVVLRIGYQGGFVAPGTDFIHMPTLLISGDGRAFAPGAQTEQYPGPLLPALTERSVDEEGMQRVLRLANDAGLLAAPPDYSLPDGIGVADAPDTVVEITVDGTTYRHQAMALGMDMPGGSSTPARDRLLAFTTLVADLEKVAGKDHVGAEQTFAADRYRFQAMVVDPTQWTDPSPTLVDWPAETGVVLAESPQCGIVDAAEVGTLFADATQLTFFVEAEAPYQLSVIGVLPGDAVC